jgi:hypothetical protein
MFLIACAVLNVLFLICATRINVVFFVIFLGASLGFILAASARWSIAEGHVALAGRLVVVCITLLHYHQQAHDTNGTGNKGTGASWFAISVLGWYLLAIQLLSTMGIPINLPVGDLTHTWDKKAKSNRGEA